MYYTERLAGQDRKLFILSCQLERLVQELNEAGYTIGEVTVAYPIGVRTMPIEALPALLAGDKVPDLRTKDERIAAIPREQAAQLTAWMDAQERDEKS